MTAREVTAALPGGRWHGSYGVARCPCHEDREPSLSIRDGADGRLLVHCFAGCDGADVLRALNRGGLLPERADRQPDPDAIERQEAEARRRVEQARRCWAEAGAISGTLAERYLRRRGIGCELPPSLRFHPSCWHGPTASKVPAMVAAVAHGRQLVGVHRTFLAEPGVKAFKDNAKMMLGRCTGGAVRLSGGAGPLLVAEGIETALTLLSGLQEARPRVWAALSTSGMAGLALPDEPGELVIAPDGDAPGREAAAKLAARAIATGWRVRVMRCPDGADWNDVAREVAA